jgi:hypothetical protein
MAMQLDEKAFSAVTSHAEDLGLVKEHERSQVLELLDPDFRFAEIMSTASSVHVHVKVDDIESLPIDDLRTADLEGERTTPGYLRLAYKGGVNLIFSSYTLAQDDLIDGAVTQAKPFVDHLGVDLRDESDATRQAFEGVVGVAERSGWRTSHQGPPVYCCYSEIGEKNWVYPPEGALAERRPIEFAFGALKVHDAHVGCDLRPIDPAHPLADQADAAACGADHYDR